MSYDVPYSHQDPWWEASEDELHERVCGTFAKIDDNQKYRNEANKVWLSSYNNQRLTGLSGADYAVAMDGARMRVNVTRNVIDSSVAHIATNRPKPQFLTIDGIYSFQRKAKALNEFCAGQFYASRQYEKSLQIFRDAAIFGTGFQHIFADYDKGEVCTERVFPDEILVDDRDARSGNPRVLFRHKEVDKHVLMKQYPKFAAQIRDSSTLRDSNYSTDRYCADPVSVIEAWHLPSSEEAGDGRHVICISGATLFDEEWEEDDFPIVKFCYADPQLGWYGTGLVEQLFELQSEINYLAEKIQKSMSLASSSVWVEEGTNVNVSQMTNEDWSVNTFRGQPPIYMNTPSISPEYVQYMFQLQDKCYEIAGISQLQASQEKPPGLNSGAAIREYNDTSSRRFMHLSQRWEQFHLDVAHKMINAARSLDEDLDEGYSLLSRGRNSIKRIDFKEVDLDEDKYVMRCFPTNFLPETPAGKMETIKEYAQVDPDLGQYLIQQLEFPDLDEYVSLRTADVQMCDMLLEEMLENGNYRSPEPFMNLQMYMKRMNLALLRADINKVPEENLDLVRQFLAEIDLLLAQQQPEPGPAMPAEEAAAPPVGEGPPV